MRNSITSAISTTFLADSSNPQFSTGFCCRCSSSDAIRALVIITILLIAFPTTSRAQDPAEVVAVINVEHAIATTDEGRSDFNTQRILQKMAPLIQKFAGDNGIAVIFDTSDTRPQSPIVWVDPRFDITQTIVGIYNGGSGHRVATTAKVGAINVEQAIFATNEGQREFRSLSKKLEPKQAELKSMNGEIESLKAQINAQPNTERRNDLARQIETKQKSLERQVQDARGDAQNQQHEIEQRILPRMRLGVVKYARDNGFSILIDTSNPWPNGPVLWAGPGVDITKAIVDAYNLQNQAADSTGIIPQTSYQQSDPGSTVSSEPSLTQQEGQSGPPGVAPSSDRENPPVELREGQTPKEVEKVLGKPIDTITLKGNLVYIYSTVKIIFENGRLVDVQYQQK